MYIRSVNLAVPASFDWKGEKVSTGIVKKATKERIAIRHDTLQGDTIADPHYHGGIWKAVYAMATEHYAYWHKKYPELDKPWGMFGENLSITGGLFEDRICLGDQLRIGDVLLEVSEPRLPCFKLGWRFGTQKVVKQFAQSEKFGFYFKVLQPGTVKANDKAEWMATGKCKATMQATGNWMLSREAPEEITQWLLDWEGLSPLIRSKIETVL